MEQLPSISHLPDFMQLMIIFGAFGVAVAYLFKYRTTGVAQLYEQNLNGLKERVDQLEATSRNQAREIETLRTENRVLRDVITGRDKEGADFRNRGLEAMEGVKEIQTLMMQHNKEAIVFRKQHSKEIRELYKSINKHLKALEK